MNRKHMSTFESEFACTCTYMNVIHSFFHNENQTLKWISKKLFVAFQKEHLFPARNICFSNGTFKHNIMFLTRNICLPHGRLVSHAVRARGSVHAIRLAHSKVCQHKDIVFHVFILSRDKIFVFQAQRATTKQCSISPDCPRNRQDKFVLNVGED